MAIQETKGLNKFSLEELIGSLMTYKMTCIEHDEHENYLLKNRKDLTIRTIDDYSSESSSEDDIELLIKKFKKFMKKNKTKLK